jgi:type II secretory pathway component GspD/PulD (secretin)
VNISNKIKYPEMISAALILAICFACNCVIANDNTEEILISNVFIDTDLRQGIADIAAQARKVITIDESVDGIISCELNEVTFDKALEIILSGTDFIVKKMPDYYLVCSRDPKSKSFPLVSNTKLIKMNYITAETAMKLLSEQFKQYVRAEGRKLCITATPSIMDRIINDIAKFDTPNQHVLLDVRIVVLEKMDLIDLGVEWSWPQVQAGVFSDAQQHSGGGKPDWLWGMQIGYTPDRLFTGALMAKLNLLDQNDKATVIANPQVMAQDGEEAEIKVLTEEYFQIVSEGYYTRSDLEKIETGTILTIKPVIAETGKITLQIGAEVSDVVARGEDNLPVVTRRSAKSMVRIDDGGTAAIAGLMDNRARINNKKAPGLSNLPLVGGLFKNTNDQNISRQVAVFVTAYLMEPDRKSDGYTCPKHIKRTADDEFNRMIDDSLVDLKNEDQTSKANRTRAQ